MAISILKSKIYFLKYLPPARPKLVPELKILRIHEIWHFRYFKYTDFHFNVKNGFYEIFISCQAKLASRLKLL